MITQQFPCKECVTLATCLGRFHDYFYVNAHLNSLLMTREERVRELNLNCDLQVEWRFDIAKDTDSQYNEQVLQEIAFDFFDSLVEDKEFGFMKKMPKAAREKVSKLLKEEVSTKNNAPTQ